MQDDLKRARANLRVLSEQVAYLQEVADDAETRRLVAETPLADREWREAKKDYDNHASLLDEARRDVEALEETRDGLLDRLFDLEGTT